MQLKWQKVNPIPSYDHFKFGFYTKSYLTCKLKLPLPENEICLHKGPFPRCYRKYKVMAAFCSFINLV